MIVECSNCNAKYNVDESKIPAAGVKVKCHKCQSIIFIKPPAREEPEISVSEASTAGSPESRVTPPETPSAVEVPSEPIVPSERGFGPERSEQQPPEPSIPQPSDTSVESPAAPVEPPPEPVPSSDETVVETTVEPPEVQAPSEADLAVRQPVEPAVQPPAESAPKETPPAEKMSEEDQKWHERARRLAKALASDLVLYNHDKVEEGLREGTLAQLLGSEIRRSWEYYCQQIPKHIVENTEYFKQQLNKIVGKGKEIFQ